VPLPPAYPRSSLGALAFAFVALCVAASDLYAQAEKAKAVQRQAADLSDAIKLFETAVGVAERACLSNLTQTERKAFSLDLGALVGSVKGRAGIENQTTALRGASDKLTGAVAKLENDDIRKCMNQYIAPIYGLVIAPYEKTDPNAAWPDPIDFRFNFARGLSKDSRKYSEYLVLNLQRTNRIPLTRRIINQYDPSGAPYFQYDISYPTTGEIIKGAITPESKGDARLSAEAPVITTVCLQRPSNLPRAKTDYDLFDCEEGKVCRPGRMTTGWLAGCGGTTGELGPNFSAPFRPVAYQLLQTAATTETRRWIAPSLEALTQRKMEGVGYTVFTVETDAFRRLEVIGVELDIRVNGTPVEENGLPPAMRPIANDANRTFNYVFALQSLNFQGAQGGCDDVAIGLTPLLAGDRKGQRVGTHLSYAALRDVEPRKERLGQSSLIWRASYITPIREWRHIPIVHSYIYPVEDAARRAKATADAEADKKWLDEQRYAYDDRPVVGVLRPPRTIQRDGTAAFGLGVGLVQDNGQIRFTFPENEARQISAFLISRRAGRDADRVIAPEPYVFQAVGGARTVPGVCGVN
jgi:hypothetical protein